MLNEMHLGLVVVLTLSFPCVEGYILTIAASPNPAVADNSFELEKIHESLDWLNLMTYDYSGDWDNYTGIDAPLYGRYQVSCH